MSANALSCQFCARKSRIQIAICDIADGFMTKKSHREVAFSGKPLFSY
jgi:hypothetical protein